MFTCGSLAFWFMSVFVHILLVFAVVFLGVASICVVSKAMLRLLIVNFSRFRFLF